MHRRTLVPLLITFALISILVGCAGNSTKNVAPAIEVRMAPTTTSLAIGSTVQFTAAAVNTANAGVSFHVNDIPGGNATLGRITSGGLYTAPATVPNPATVTVKAISMADPTKMATASLTITSPAMTITITPATANVEVKKTATFTATLTGNANTTVTWSVVGGNTNGTISSDGVYTAPATVPTPATVTIQAVANADPTKSATATVTVTSTAAPPAVTVGVAPKTANVVLGGTQQFTASVANATNGSVTWKVNGVTGGDTTYGIIDNKGLYTAPATLPPATKPAARTAAAAGAEATVDVTISAVSDEDATKQDTAVVTLSEPAAPAVTISPKTADVTVKGTQQFTANVTGTTDNAVDWTIEGCTTGCGSIDTTGKYTAPDTLPASTVTIKVALHADATKFDTATVTVKAVVTNNDKLSGKYAFLFSGYKGTAEIARIGNFTADGAGAITAGEMKAQIAGQAATSGTLTGTYTVFEDNRGEMTLTMNSASIKYRFVLKGNGDGKFIEFDEADANGMHGAGEFKKEDATSLEGLAAANYVLGVSGSLNGSNRMGILAQFNADLTGNTSGGQVDIAVAADTSKIPALKVTTEKKSTDSMYVTVMPQGMAQYKFWVYLASADDGYAMIDNSTGTEAQYMVGRYKKQSGTFTNATLNGPVVFTVSGYDLDPGDRTKTGIGQVVFDGAGTFTGHIDQNDISDPQVNGAYGTYMMHGDYTVSSNGRVQGNFFVGPSPQSVPLIFYLYGPNKGFLMDGVRTTDIVKDVNVGTLEPQTGGPFNSTAGAFTLGWTDTFTRFVELPIGALTFTTDGKFSGTLDDATEGTVYPDQIVNGTYAVAAGDAAFGRSTTSVKLPDNTTHPLVLYSVSPTKVYGILIDPNDGNGVVMTFEQ